MSFPRYPAYKPSGVEWLGEVPEHWEVLPLKREFDVVGGSTPKSDMQEYWDGDIQWITPADLSRLQSFEITKSIRTITAEGLNSCGATMVQSGSVVVSTRAPIGSLGIAGIDLCTNQGCKALVPIHQISSRFTAYFLGIATDALNIRGRGATFLEISGDELGAFKATLPPCQEQIQIATFLDRETAKIDALIAEQQRLIELLQEKRQAVISHAVTKGLNTDAPMKDSGVEWLGEVPEHWTLKRLKHLSPSLTVGIVVNPSEYVSDEGLPFVYGGDIREGIIDWENSRRIAPALSDKQPKTLLRSGDLLMVRVGAPGITAVVPAECEGGNCASVMLIRQGSFSSQWLCYTLNTRIVRFQVEVVQYGAAQEQFNISHAVNFWLPVPPRQEQERIAAILDIEHEKAQGLIQEALSAVSLLQERRSALISAAVTGQIDVRGLVPETEAA
jgi:type I restriction enzyme S subunit